MPLSKECRLLRHADKSLTSTESSGCGQLPILKLPSYNYSDNVGNILSSHKMTYHPKDAEAQYKYFQYTKVLYVHNKQ